MLSMAVVPASAMRSPHDRPEPYLSFTGCSSARALSRLVCGKWEEMGGGAAEEGMGKGGQGIGG